VAVGEGGNQHLLRINSRHHGHLPTTWARRTRGQLSHRQSLWLAAAVAAVGKSSPLLSLQLDVRSIGRHLFLALRPDVCSLRKGQGISTSHPLRSAGYIASKRRLIGFIKRSRGAQ